MLHRLRWLSKPVKLLIFKVSYVVSISLYNYGSQDTSSIIFGYRCCTVYILPSRIAAPWTFLAACIGEMAGCRTTKYYLSSMLSDCIFRRVQLGSAYCIFKMDIDLPTYLIHVYSLRPFFSLVPPIVFFFIPFRPISGHRFLWWQSFSFTTSYPPRNLQVERSVLLLGSTFNYESIPESVNNLAGDHQLD